MDKILQVPNKRNFHYDTNLHQDNQSHLWIVAVNNSNDDGIKLTKKMATKTEIQQKSNGEWSPPLL